MRSVLQNVPLSTPRVARHVIFYFVIGDFQDARYARYLLGCMYDEKLEDFSGLHRICLFWNVSTCNLLLGNDLDVKKRPSYRFRRYWYPRFRTVPNLIYGHFSDTSFPVISSQRASGISNAVH